MTFATRGKEHAEILNDLESHDAVVTVESHRLLWRSQDGRANILTGSVCAALTQRFVFDVRGIRVIFGVVVWSWGAPRDGPGALFRF